MVTDQLYVGVLVQKGKTSKRELVDKAITIQE